MLTAPARSTAVPVLGELPAGVMGATTVSALLSPISGSTQLPFDGYLRERFSRSCREVRQIGRPAAHLCGSGRVPSDRRGDHARAHVDLLFTDALVHAFPPGRGGRIAVSFTADQEAWQLTVDDSGVATRSHGNPRDNGLTIARQLVVRISGLLNVPRVIGGTRCIVTLPRPERKGSISGISPPPRLSRPEQRVGN
jgi:hypothetical protein